MLEHDAWMARAGTSGVSPHDRRPATRPNARQPLRGDLRSVVRRAARGLAGSRGMTTDAPQPTSLQTTGAEPLGFFAVRVRQPVNELGELTDFHFTAPLRTRLEAQLVIRLGARDLRARKASTRISLRKALTFHVVDGLVFNGWDQLCDPVTGRPAEG